jgi:hypothetical protein
VKSCFSETTPQVVSQEISKFCEGIVPGGVPVFVPVRPVAGAEENGCHVNVAGHVKENGGEAVFGWIVWQSRVLLHAEAHCNWRSPHGEMIDITPKLPREAKVLFLPDPDMKWEGRVIPSCRAARIDSPKAHDLVRLLEESDRIQARYRTFERFSFRDEQRILSLQVQADSLTLEIERMVRSVSRSPISTRQRKEKRKAQRRAKKRNRK